MMRLMDPLPVLQATHMFDEHVVPHRVEITRAVGHKQSADGEEKSSPTPLLRQI